MNKSNRILSLTLVAILLGAGNAYSEDWYENLEGSAINYANMVHASHQWAVYNGTGQNINRALMTTEVMDQLSGDNSSATSSGTFETVGSGGNAPPAAAAAAAAMEGSSQSAARRALSNANRAAVVNAHTNTQNLLSVSREIRGQITNNMGTSYPGAQPQPTPSPSASPGS